MLGKSDLILYPSQEEVDAVKASKPNRQAAVLPLACGSDSEINEGITPTPFSDRCGLLFVGFFAHKPNKDAMLWFLDQVYPIILRHCPDIPLVIAGGEPPAELTSQVSDRVTVTGLISDEELRNLYSRVRISIAPLRVGAGVKGKVVESMKMGVPVATTSIGIQGLCDTEQAIAVGDSPEELADIVIKLHSHESTWTSFRESGIQYYRKHFSTAAVSSRVLPLLGV